MKLKRRDDKTSEPDQGKRRTDSSGGSITGIAREMTRSSTPRLGGECFRPFFLGNFSQILKEGYRHAQDLSDSDQQAPALPLRPFVMPANSEVVWSMCHANEKENSRACRTFGRQC